METYTAKVRPQAPAEPARRVSLWRTPRTRALLIVGTVGCVGGLLWLVTRVYTDVLWFREVGQEPVFWTTLTWKVLVPALAGLGTTCFLLLNLALVERVTRGLPAPSQPGVAQLWRFRKLVYPVAAVAGGVISLDARPEGTWRLLLLWVNRSDFGVEDPLFHRDVGFFVFSLPLYQQVAAWLLTTVLMAGGLTVVAYAVAGGLREARPQLASLAALLLLVIAWRFRLDQFALALPHKGVVPGATYTDVQVRVPTFRILALLSLVGAALCVYAAMRRVRLLAVAVVGALAVLTTAAASAAPSLIERFDVAPQVLSRERPYVVDAIAATRRAFDLDRVTIRTVPGPGSLSAAEIEQNRRTVENVPLWDSGVLRPAINELQSIGGYYGFPSATIDRYTIGGVPWLMTVAARQLDLSRLSDRSRTWTNERFAYTHGYGVVAVQAGQVDSGRYPRFAQRAFRPSGRNPLGLRQPRIYYGQRSSTGPPYLIVRSTRGEVEEPVPGSQAPGYHYDGPGGIALSNPLRRAAFAARFGDFRLLLTSNVTDRSRLILRRGVRERLEALAPFLRWDSHPQTAVIDGRVQFLFHGYTTSRYYPYSAPVTMGDTRVNYVRGSATAVVDAFSGRVSIYADPGDPILQAWQGAYPSLFQPISRMPSQVRAHLRYPRQLFSAQAKAYATYHADDATGFWNGADAWQQSRQLAGPVENVGEIHFPDAHERLDADERSRREGWWLRPGYVFARLPGDTRERFMLATAFTPRGRENLVGYLAGSVDRSGRPQLTLLSLPRDRLTTGPTQATREILATPGVNRRLQLLNRESRDLGRASVNRTVLGAPSVLPLGGTLVHVQSVYVTAGGSGLPRLQLVTVLANGRVGYGRDVEVALRRALGG